MEKGLPEVSKALGSRVSVSKIDEAIPDHSDQVSSMISNVDFSYLSERLKKIIDEFRLRYGATQISGIRLFRTNVP